MAEDPIRDPHYRQIVAALDAPLDPAVFERCMGDLVHDTLPGLTPVTGGQDAGFDGAVAEGDGEPYPLICTISPRAERNLRASLGSNRMHRFPSRKAAFATSQALSPKSRERLFKAARDLGFTLMQVFDRSAIADRLYRNSRWCRDLLGIVGTPAALSVVPRTRRPLIEIEPVGREADLEWIRSEKGDRVLVGDPGSGKTFLFYHLIHRQSWGGLFAVDDDRTSLANALRDLRPSAIVVDDAHAHLERLETLRHLRQEGLGGDFEIFATTWQGERNAVMEALGGQAKIRKLELLTRREILEVFRKAGVEIRDDLMAALIDQAAQKPGLAVTLAALWLQGDWQNILSGQILSRTLLQLFRDLTGTDTSSLLACFSLGGNAGMSMETVGRFLGQSRIEVLQLVTALAAGGVLSSRADDALVVSPEALRHALVRQAFFPEDGAPKLPYREILACAPIFSSAVETLLAARIYGACISDTELKELVTQIDPVRQLESDRQNPEMAELLNLMSEEDWLESLRKSFECEAWALMACVSNENALWVLEHFPADLTRVAAATLRRAPEETIVRLLSQVVPAQVSATLESPHRILADWLNDPLAVPEVLLDRRQRILAASIRFLRSEGSPANGVWGIALALNPYFWFIKQSFVDETEIRESRGITPILRSLPALWAPARDTLLVLGDLDGWWEQIRALVRAWIHPRDFKTLLSAEIREEMRRFAGMILRDLSPLAHTAGWASAFLDLAGEMGIVLPLEPDRGFELLYPTAKDSGVVSKEALRTLAEEWAREAPEQIAARLAFYEREAQKIGRRGGGAREPEVGRELAQRVHDPGPWAEAFLEADLVGFFVEPLLERVVQERLQGWERLLESGLRHDRGAFAAAASILALEEPPANLLLSALERLRTHPQSLELLCTVRVISAPNLLHLLDHSDLNLSLPSAIGLWNARQGPVPSELAAAWRSVFLRPWRIEGPLAESSIVMGHWLSNVFSRDPTLASQWFVARAMDPEGGLDALPLELLAAVVETQDGQQQAELFTRLEVWPEATERLRQAIHLNTHPEWMA